MAFRTHDEAVAAAIEWLGGADAESAPPVQVLVAARLVAAELARLREALQAEVARDAQRRILADTERRRRDGPPRAGFRGGRVPPPAAPMPTGEAFLAAYTDPALLSPPDRMSVKCPHPECGHEYRWHATTGGACVCAADSQTPCPCPGWYREKYAAGGFVPGFVLHRPLVGERVWMRDGRTFEWTEDGWAEVDDPGNLFLRSDLRTREQDR